MQGEIKNKIADAGLITIDLLDYLSNRKQVGIDLRDWLIDDLIIKEIDFKEKLKKLNVDNFKNCNVFIYCSRCNYPYMGLFINTGKNKHGC